MGNNYITVGLITLSQIRVEFEHDRDPPDKFISTVTVGAYCFYGSAINLVTGSGSKS